MMLFSVKAPLSHALFSFDKILVGFNISIETCVFHVTDLLRHIVLFPSSHDHVISFKAICHSACVGKPIWVILNYYFCHLCAPFVQGYSNTCVR